MNGVLGISFVHVGLAFVTYVAVGLCVCFFTLRCVWYPPHVLGGAFLALSRSVVALSFLPRRKKRAFSAATIIAIIFIPIFSL